MDDCGAQSLLPKKVWYNAATGKPIVTFKKGKPPKREQTSDLPKFLLQAGSVPGRPGLRVPALARWPSEVQFYRNVAANTPYADVSAAPAIGDPPDACGGYVMANLPNDVVSLVHIPRVPTFPDYRGATPETLNNTDQFDVTFYSVVIYGADKQLDALGTVKNSQLGNRQLKVAADGSATIVLYPRSATKDQVQQIKRVVDANGWNLLRSGQQNDFIPNLLVIREKGANADLGELAEPQQRDGRRALSADEQPDPAAAAGPGRRPGHPVQRHGAVRSAGPELHHQGVPVGRLPQGLRQAALR